MQELSDPSCRALRDGEDPLSIPACEVPAVGASAVPAGLGGGVAGPITVLHYCKFSEMLLTGHADGKVRVGGVSSTIRAREDVVAAQTLSFAPCSYVYG